MTDPSEVIDYSEDMREMRKNLQGAWDRLDELDGMPWFFLQQRVGANGDLLCDGESEQYTLNELAEQFFKARQHPDLIHEFEGVQDFFFHFAEALIRGVRLMLIERKTSHLEMAVSVQQMDTLLTFMSKGGGGT